MTDTFDHPFFICIGEAFISQADDSNTEDRVQAIFGSRDAAAIFNLADGVLSSGGWILGRDMIEDQSLGAKPVYWFRGEGRSQGNTVERLRTEDGYVVLSSSSPLIAVQGLAFAALHPGDARLAEALLA
ncbi:hypothetical protein ABOM_000800 [Aspergillus bombycis]|uniref:Uncharacterized protein n=1 Tax=Aspergillus bombycis TaxID=109264 RepID=A0A1F8AGE7_9EURO|nr:hypothetical protein ABOM_000800 [Aspergillus bombycis]OGM50814.1 hypothetical protein ABOM_000800 [Aspergillus bombycis]